MAMPPNRAWLGSSPHGRGKLRDWWGTSARLGLIPARAGKTASTAWSLTSPPAHPRVGGENGQAIEYTVAHQGSSPRRRGKPGTEVARPVLDRLIPA
ncbi:hypothetical protein HMPREF1980_02373 [Actinomyces sp. oral taxon 172 str. F0311]|nr:hypothetical protein HMPREF1980_02373 [Actinomyces sp. oral taxon 172 str. F0311]